MNTVLRRIEKFFFLTLLLFAGFLLRPPLIFAADNDQTTSGTISSEEFVASEAAALFQAEDYGRAIPALDSLTRKYPRDPLLLRYKAMALDRMGRSQEAIELFGRLLREEPNHVPTRYFLAEAYERNGRRAEAIQEWTWVVENAEATPYQSWARENLSRVETPRPREEKPKPEKRAVAKRLQIAARYGYEYDSNVRLKPEDKSVASSEDTSAGRQQLDLSARYRAYTRRDIAIDILYGAAQTLHDDSLDEFNFTSQDAGLDVRKRVKILDRDVIFGARYDFLLGFLNGDIFSTRNRFTLTADTRLSQKTRTVPFYRLTPADFGPDGSNPPQTSRDGLYQDLGITQYWYTGDFRKHFFIRQEYNRSDVRGGNFETRGETTRLGFHAPLVLKSEIDLSTGLEYTHYPRFSSQSPLDTARRRDIHWDIYAAVTHYLTPQIGVRLFYRFMDAENRNNFFEYDRHIGGFQILFAESF